MRRQPSSGSAEWPIREAITPVDTDDQLLAEVAQALGTSTKKETVNTALREMLENSTAGPA